MHLSLKNYVFYEAQCTYNPPLLNVEILRVSFHPQFAPLTPVQEAMVAASSKRPGLYLEQIVCHLDQECLNPEILSGAFQSLVEQSPVLRLAIQANEAARLTQHIAPSQDVPIETLDWTCISRGETNKHLQELLRTDRARGCPLNTPPCFRLTLIKTSQTTSILIWTFPHALLDGRSFAPLLAQAFINYEAIEAGYRPSVASKPNRGFGCSRKICASDPEHCGFGGLGYCACTGHRSRRCRFWHDP